MVIVEFFGKPLLNNICTLSSTICEVWHAEMLVAIYVLLIMSGSAEPHPSAQLRWVDRAVSDL